MFKRFVISILSVIMAGTMLCGCSFFSHNYERDYRQVVAEISAYEIKTEVATDRVDATTGETVTQTEVKSYSVPKHTLYKRDLIEYVNNNQSSLSQSYTDTESLVKHAMEMLIDTELIINEVDALIDAGRIEWGQNELNAVKRQAYTVIDNSLVTIKNELLEDRDKPTIDTDITAAETNTTYPVKPEQEDDDEDVPQEEAWEPSISSYPGLTGDSETRSLEREAMRRFIDLLKDRVADDFRVTDADKAKFKEDDARIKEITDSKGISYVYPMIADTHYFYCVSGKNIERSQKITALNDYLSDSVSVSDSEVAEAFAAALNSQKSEYENDVAAFETAMSGSDPVLYYPNSDYFYVKHILLPFSEEQKTELTEYKKTATKAEAEEYRARMVDNIVCYPHVAGEDDKSQPKTVKQVMDEIKSVMSRYESNVMLADAAFDDLIYKYNTDPGAFGNNKGYVVKDADEGNNYMQEFTDAAIEMRHTLEPGQVYGEAVVTDYGVHVMYLASTTAVGAVSLYDYTTPGKIETYYDVYAEKLRNARVNVAYTDWEANILNYNYKKYAKVYEDVFSDLWEG